MITSRDVLNAYGYQAIEQQRGLVKLAAYCGFYGVKFLNQLPKDKAADDFLSQSFDTPQAGMAWWGTLADKYWLRGSFKDEGLQKGKDLTINVERWKESKLIAKQEQEYQILAILKSLNLVDPVAWPTKPLSHAAIHGAMGECLENEIEFMKDFSGQWYYMTSLRGLFNDEPYLAYILAAWFKRSDKNSIQLIQEVLKNHINFKISNKHWLKDLNGLKQEILAALGETVWPTHVGWYHKNPEPFQITTEREGRQSLEGWPTAMDAVEYLLEKRKLAEPEKFKNVELIAVYSMRDRVMPTTEDNIKDFYNQHYKFLPKGTPIVFVSSNLRHYIEFQDIILKQTLKQIIPADDFHEVISPMMTIGSGAKKVNLSAATDTLAKILFTKRNDSLQKIIKDNINIESVQEMTDRGAKNYSGLVRFFGDSDPEDALSRNDVRPNTYLQNIVK